MVENSFCIVSGAEAFHRDTPPHWEVQGWDGQSPLSIVVLPVMLVIFDVEQRLAHFIGLPWRRQRLWDPDFAHMAMHIEGVTPLNEPGTEWSIDLKWEPTEQSFGRRMSENKALLPRLLYLVDAHPVTHGLLKEAAELGNSERA